MKILDIGCGRKKFVSKNFEDEIIGLDSYKVPEVDVVHDLGKPLPFKENEFDMVNASHVLEHVDDVGVVVKEIWRVLKPNGIFRIACPHFSSYLAYGDPTHKRFFTAFSMDPWLEKKEIVSEGSHHAVGSVDKAEFFNLKSRRFDCSKFWFFAAPFASAFPKIYEGSFLRSIFPMASIYFELEAIK